MYYKKIILFLLTLYMQTVCSVNILCIMSVMSHSHHIWNRVIINALAAKGHNMTILSHDIDHNTPPNISYIHLEKSYEMGSKTEALNFFSMTKQSKMSLIMVYHEFSILACRWAFASDGFKKLEDYPDSFKFDLVLFDYATGPCLLGFLEKFNYPPLVGFSAFNNPPEIIQVIGGHKYTAYIPHYLMPYSTTMNFYQRSYNTLVQWTDEIYRKYLYLPRLDKLSRPNYKNQNFPYIGDLEKLAKVLLVNTNPAFDFPEPLPPNVIQVGCLQIESPKPLPSELQKFIESSKQGTVLFTLGSNIRSDLLPIEKQQILIEAFRQLPQYNFLWKFESMSRIELPKNVFISSWLPQTSILAHPNLKAFMSHAGLLGVHESFWFGVPIIAMPIYIDQMRNAQRAVDLGAAEILSIESITIDQVKNIILKVLKTSSYTERAKQLSKQLQDTPEKPLDLAIWWIEWVLRNPNSTSLQSPTMKLGWFCSNSHDLTLLLFLVTFLVCYIIKMLFSVCNRRQSIREKNKLS